ncbi:MAG: acyl-CoA/acyl-ACP dehydrogenase [Sneathiellales bacterium]|nr:acyl-CoA/acyl-ACP dehydrogenase [Sneathiellales bacterium]
MTTKNTPEILEQIHLFASQHIREKQDQLIRQEDFAQDLWNAFRESGLAGLCLPEEFGGLNANLNILAEAVYILNRVGGVPGATMCLSSHWLIPYLHIARNASHEIQQMLLPEIAAGKKTLSVAISEPGAGAHPKKLSSSATRTPGNFRLNGEKAFLTNGPVADYFLVLAISGEEELRKAFSLYLVSAETTGLSKTPGIPLDFLHPCPHGGISLQDCDIPLNHLIGEEGKAFEQTSLVMRAVEDAVHTKAQLGLLDYILDELKTTTSPSDATALGEIALQMDLLSLQCAKVTDLLQNNPDPAVLSRLYLGFKQHFKPCFEKISKLRQIDREAEDSHLSLLYRDIGKLNAIAQSAHKAQLNKLGLTLLRKA